MNISASEWMKTIRAEYLGDFVKHGGAAVKFCISSDEGGHDAVRTMLRQASQEEGYAFAAVDASSVKMHQIDQVFFSIAKQIDWDEVAGTYVREFFLRNNYEMPNVGDFSLKSIADYNQYEEMHFRNRVISGIEKDIFRDHEMSQEFRIAMIRLCINQLDPQSPSVFLSNAVKEWLQGELRLISVLKEALIFQKITRHNARYMLYSLAHWLKRNGKSGLVITLDISRCMMMKNQSPDAAGLFYSSAAVLDAYEVLRQFIDGTDEMEGILIVVLAPTDFLADEKRGLSRYDALKMRIWDEVRDRQKQNPLASLVRIFGL